MLSLRPYQHEAADFLYANDRGMVLAPVGAGKTATTLVALRDLMGDGYARRALIIAPLRVATSTWPTEARLWAPELTMSVCTGSPAARVKALAAQTQLVVTNYDNLQWLATQKLDFDVLVFDELTRLKNPSGARFKALFKVIKDIKIRWGLTGSFTSNGLEDVFGQCKIIDEMMLGRSKGAFMQQYFHCINRDYNDWVALPGSLERVMRLIKPWTYVLEAQGYKDTLPPLHTVTVPVTMDLAQYKTMKRDLVLQFDGTTIVAQHVIGKLQQLASGFVYDEGRIAVRLHSDKLDALENIWLENQRAPTLVWYQFEEELMALRARFPRCETLVNSDTVDRWNAGYIEMLAVHPQSAGHGLNLQGQSKMIWLSLPWSFELYEQAVGRLHRSGQQSDVWNYVLLTQGTVDEVIWQTLGEKRSMSETAMEALK
jgi:SNF2 family DNA or RNA helicase